MPGGYIKLYRKSLESSIWQNHKLWRFWTWCLLKATHKNRTAQVGYQNVELEPGQFVFGIHKASQTCGLSARTVRSCLSTLQTTQNVTIKTTNKFSVITIVNWVSYQTTENTNDNQSDKQTTNKRQTNDKQTTTDKKNKNVKNVKNVEEKRLKEKEEGFVLPDWVDPVVWSDFKEFRTKKKAPLTNRAMKETILDLEKLKASGNDPNAVILQSIKRGWSGVFELKDKQAQAPKSLYKELPPIPADGGYEN